MFSAQLPPVGTLISAALDKGTLSAFGYNIREVFFDEVVRQSLDSGILYNATKVRRLISSEKQFFPSLKLAGFSDIERISGNEMNELLDSAYGRYGLDDTIVVCRSNKQANRYNEGIRRMMLGREDEISQGDYLMVVKNNYFWLDENKEADFIANGDICKVLKIKGYQTLYGHRFADIIASFIDYPGLEVPVKIMLDTLNIEGPSLSSEQNREFFYSVAEDYDQSLPRKKLYEKVKEDSYYNALQVKFAYAVTCHKAQGGQWKAVFVDQGFLKEDMINQEYLRWLYTAFTRATEKLYLVNFAPQFFA